MFCHYKYVVLKVQKRFGLEILKHLTVKNNLIRSSDLFYDLSKEYFPGPISINAIKTAKKRMAFSILENGSLM